MISDALKRAFEKKEKRGWDKWPKMYIFIDLHDVIIPGTYTHNNANKEFYPYAKCVLQYFTDDSRFCIILWTASHKTAIDEICEWLDYYDIKFDYINENPECHSTELLDVSKKPYFDLLLEDKAGFNAEYDWMNIMETLINMGEWEDY